jgi:uncharacterized protein YjeT (DUF2065 family)
MPSLLHEGILELIRERPGFAADLLRQVLHIEVPAFTEARLAEGALNDVVPVEYRADAVILFVDGRPVFGCIVEAQLTEDPRKSFTWPVYAVTARARHECPFVVLVIAPEEAVADWAARAIELGGGQAWKPLVVGPSGIPAVTDPAEAAREPELALLSALAHSRGDPDLALTVTIAALAGVAAVSAEQQVIYFHLLRAAVGDAARKAFEMLPQRLEKYLTDEERQRMLDARTEGLASALVQVVEGRGLQVSPALRQRIARAPAEQLNRMLSRAALVVSADDLFDGEKLASKF